MTFKRFVFLSLLLPACIALLFVGFNVGMNEFGLYGRVQAGERRVWSYERATKYLFSLNYIPKNFSGLLIGSSSSVVMLNTRKIKGARLYNLSMNGANVCEVAPAAINALERGHMRQLVICLDPYFTKDSMMKTSELSKNIKTSAYGSLFNIRFYLYKVLYSMHPETDPYRDSWWGYRLMFQSGEHNNDLPRQINNNRSIAIDKNAVACLKNVIDTAHKNNVLVFAYFHPRRRQDAFTSSSAYATFEVQMKALFSSQDRVFDFNTPDFYFLTEDAAAFYDNVHLTEKGADAVLKEIERNLVENR